MQHPTDFRTRVLRTPLLVSSIFAAAGLAFAQSGTEVKVVQPLPPPSDVKVPAPIEAPAPVFPEDVKDASASASSAQARGTKIPGAPRSSGERSPVERNQVYSSAPRADGTIWSRGYNWKARFDASGTQFIPYIPCAPTNYPIEFRVASIEVGGTPVEFDPAALPAISGTTVTFDRGSVVERYELSPGSIEQFFVFESLPAGGDLVVRLAVDSEFASGAASEGIEFENEHGRVAYGKATVLDAAGRAASAGPALRGPAIELRVPADFLATAAFPVTIDPVVSTFDVDVSSFDNFEADVAYDVSTDRYLVVYEEEFSGTDHDVYSRRLSGSGALVGGGYIDSSSEHWKLPRVANNNLANQFLVVAQVAPAGTTTYGIDGALVNASTGSIGSPFDISGSETGVKLVPDVGGDPALVPPTYYCVVWERVFTSTDHDVHFNLVTTSGTLLSSSSQHIDDTPATYDAAPSISKSDGAEPFSTQNWNVAWPRVVGSHNDIRGAQVLWNGTITSPSFPIDTSSANDVEICASSSHDAATGPRDWILVYTRLVGNDYDTRAKVLHGSTVVGDTNVSGLEAAGGSGTFLEHQVAPSVDCDGSKFLVTYAETYQGSSFDFDTWIASLDVVGSSLQLTEGHKPLGFTFDYEAYSRLTTQRSSGGPAGRAMIVWERYDPSQNDGNVHGGLYDAPTFHRFCSPYTDAISCPCGNQPSGANRGCNNSANTGGGMLTATGSPVSDTVVLQASSMRPSSLCIFFQGNTVNASGQTYGDGVRCATGFVRRLYTKNGSTGSASAPTGGDPSIKTRSAQLADPIASGTTRWYQVYYRDPANYACTGLATFNTTAGVVVDWP